MQIGESTEIGAYDIPKKDAFVDGHITLFNVQSRRPAKAGDVIRESTSGNGRRSRLRAEVQYERTALVVPGRTRVGIGLGAHEIVRSPYAIDEGRTISALNISKTPAVSARSSRTITYKSNPRCRKRGILEVEYTLRRPIFPRRTYHGGNTAA